MKKAIIFLVLITATVNAQDLAFNNTHHTLVYLNPSFAGSNGCIRNQTFYRNQYPNYSNNFVTYGSCFDGYIKPIRGGVAVSVMSDDQARGTLRHTNATISYAQYITISALKIIPSMQVSYNQYSLDKGRLNYGDMINSRYGQVWNGGSFGPNWGQYTGPMPVSSIKYTNVAAGLLMYYHGSYFGVTCANLNEPEISLLSDQQLKMPIRTTIYASTNFAFGKRTVSNVMGYYSQQKRSTAKVRILNTYNDRILYGLGYDFSDLLSRIKGYSGSSFELYAGARVRSFTLGYCYQRMFTNFSGSPTSHEVSLSISLKKKDQEGSLVLEKR